MKFIIVLLVFIGSFNSLAQQNISSQPLVMVTGEGVVNIKPDQVVINSRIEHEGNDAAEVKKKNDEVVNRVIKYLRSEGIPDKNIRTNYLNLNKNYNYDDKSYSYVANQAISIKLEDLEDYERIMSGLLDIGLNRIDGVQFQSSKLEEFTAEARRKAVLDAKRKAEEYVAPLNQSIGKALTITELEKNNYQPMFKTEMLQSGSDAGMEESISPGEMEVNVKVTVGFLLN